MSVLTRPRHPVVATALQLAREWCDGQEIDGAPALAHAVQVALKVSEHLPAASPDLVAAVLVHDSPEFAPPTINLDAGLEAWLGSEARRIVRALQHEHEAMDARQPTLPDIEDLATLCASAADKIVSLSSILARAACARDPGAFWRVREPFIELVPYFRDFHCVLAPKLSGGLACELGRLVAAAEMATSPASDRSAMQDAELDRIPERSRW